MNPQAAHNARAFVPRTALLIVDCAIQTGIPTKIGWDDLWRSEVVVLICNESIAGSEALDQENSTGSAKVH